MRSEPPTGDELTRMLVSMKRNVLEQVGNEPATAKRLSRTDRIVGGVLAGALLAGVAAGAAFVFGLAPLGQYSMDPAATTSPKPVTSPSPTPTPTPTPPPTEEPAAPGMPESRYGLTCESLVDPALVSDLFTTDVAPADPIVTASGVGIAVPRITSIFSVGGTVCEWSNGVAENDQYGWEPEYVGVTVSIVPQPVAGWSERATQYGMPDDRSRCDVPAGDGPVLCAGSQVVGDAWLTVVAHGEPSVIDQPSWQPFYDAILEAVNAAGPAAAPTAPEQVGTPPAEDCEAVLPLDTVRSITGAPDAEPQRAGGGGWSAWAEARQTAGDVGCLWSILDADTAASVDWVNDGRWAFERMLQAGTTSPVELAGLSADDAAVLRCNVDPYGDSCAIDLGVGNDWYNVAGTDRDSAIALAEAVLAQLQR
ncbi:hypothetical protein [Agromyces sp. NPDC049794]|uniref:hypothetical protein n=1 Tax=unclassified Agromyces TaxID=2639701 RepID=UPI0033CAA4EE